MIFITDLLQGFFNLEIFIEFLKCLIAVLMVQLVKFLFEGDRL